MKSTLWVLAALPVFATTTMNAQRDMDATTSLTQMVGEL